MNKRVNTPSGSIPELGESFLQMYPHRSRRDSSSRRAIAHRSIRSVWSIPVLFVIRWGRFGSPTSRIASRGTESPHSTSGQTGTHSTNGASVSLRKKSRLCPPS